MQTRADLATLCFSGTAISFASCRSPLLFSATVSEELAPAEPQTAPRSLDLKLESDMAHLVTVTGAGGNNGKAIAQALLGAGVRVRAVGRKPEHLAALAARGAEVYTGDLTDPDFLTGAFRGADAVFAMIPQHFDAPDYESDQRRMVESTTEALLSAETSHVVALSTPAAKTRLGLPAILAEFEHSLKSMPRLNAVVLQPMYYMENHLAAVPFIRSTGIMAGPIRGDRPLPMIATRDVAGVAVDYLLDPSFEGYVERQLLGPRDYTFKEVASVLGDSVGISDLPYIEFAYDDARLGLISGGFSASAADAFVEMARALNDGLVEVHRDESATTPTTLDMFAREIFATAYFAA